MARIDITATYLLGLMCRTSNLEEAVSSVLCDITGLIGGVIAGAHSGLSYFLVALLTSGRGVGESQEWSLTHRALRRLLGGVCPLGCLTLCFHLLFQVRQSAPLMEN